MKADYKTIPEYHKGQSQGDRAICDALKKEIEASLPKAESKIWHGHPVWFLDGNPIVGYHKLKDCVRILFWSGQSFDEEGLAPEGTFKAAVARYNSIDEVKVTPLRRWLTKSKKIQWDYKNIVKRRGELVRLALAIGLLCFAAPDASACSCMPQGNILERKGLSDRVFSGRLVSETIDTTQGTKRMEFTIQKAWKQGRREWVKRIRIESPLESAACGFEMKVGDRAIIFATARKENGRMVYRTNLCSENVVNPGRRQVDSLGMKAPRRPVPKAVEAEES